MSDETKLGATGRVMIVPDATNNETDMESMNNIRIMNDNLNDNASSDMSDISEDEPQAGAAIRKLRTSHPDDRLTDEKAEQALRTMKGVIQGNTDERQDGKTKAVLRLQEVITDAQYALDLVFSVGTLATLASVARSDSAQYGSKLQDGRYKEALDNAKIWLKSTAKKISDLEPNNSEFLRYWLGVDAWFSKWQRIS